MLISQEKTVGASVVTEPHLEDAERKKLQSRIYIKLKKSFKTKERKKKKQETYQINKGYRNFSKANLLLMSVCM